MSNLLKKLITTLIITALLGVGYFFFLRTSVEDTGLESGNTEDITLRTEKILADTREISNYALDVSIFSDKRFTSLTDFSVKIDDVDTGRKNPFEPVR